MTSRPVAAVDLGASSGRVIVGRVGPRDLELTEVHRFPNEPVRLPDGLHWDALRLYREVLTGIREAVRVEPDLASIGIDSWGVDYGLIDDRGALLGEPHHYRDERTSAAVRRVHATVPPEELYARTGLQFLPFNTLYQLAAEGAARLDSAAAMLLMPDLLTYWLTGSRRAEQTNASTTGLLDVDSRDWDTTLATTLGLPPRILPPIAAPGDIAGHLRDDVRLETGASAATVVTLVGSHDTASAVVGVPAEDRAFAYISCGTWSLVGLELDRPVLTDESRAANFTNEGGVDGRIRYLRNVMGLWLLQESLRTWELAGEPAQLPALLDAAGDLPVGGPTFDPDDASFLAPGDMPTRISVACEAQGSRPPATRPELVRSILDSLAAAYARAVRDATRLAGRSVDVVHLVGGGARNTLLCQLTADACELPVVAGPAEATAIGNVLVQARAHGFVTGDLERLRALIRSTAEVRTFEPRVSSNRSGR